MYELARSLVASCCASGDAWFTPLGRLLSQDPSTACATISGTLSGSRHEAPSNATATCACAMSSSRMRTSLIVNFALPYCASRSSVVVGVDGSFAKASFASFTCVCFPRREEEG